MRQDEALGVLTDAFPGESVAVQVQLYRNVHGTEKRTGQRCTVFIGDVCIQDQSIWKATVEAIIVARARIAAEAEKEPAHADTIH